MNKGSNPIITYLVPHFRNVLDNFKCYTIEPVLKDHPIGHKNVVCQDRWSLVTGSVILNCRSFCQKCVVCQDRWFLLAVVSQDWFYCIMTYQGPIRLHIGSSSQVENGLTIYIIMPMAIAVDQWPLSTTRLSLGNNY